MRERMMKGRGMAYGAGTIVNAIATWKGAAFAIGLTTTVEVSLVHSDEMHIEAKMDTPTDPSLMLRCAELVLERFGMTCEGVVASKSDIPIASGLKSSSAVANATVMATLEAIGERLPPEEVVRMGVRAALETGVSITGAYDDACASFFGGVVLTDNRHMRIEMRDTLGAEVMVYVPKRSQLTSEVDVGACTLLAPFVHEAYAMAREGRYAEAMTINGLLYGAALGYGSDVVMDALQCGAAGCGLSGTGPAYTALFVDGDMDALEERWRSRGATVIKTRVVNEGVEV